MKRRTFLKQGSIITAGLHFSKILNSSPGISNQSNDNLYSLFQHPSNKYKPFVRWWWNGDKVEKEELARELRLLKEAGIGGVEINPVKFPARTDDLGKGSVQWLSAEWIDLLAFTIAEAKSLDMTCDLIVGSGWPLGAETLAEDERSQIMVIGTKKLSGPLDYEVSIFELFHEADPAISSPFSGRKMEMISVILAPVIVSSLTEVKNLSDQIPSGTIKCNIPDGKYVLYALVKYNGFMEVIQGAPGATGPVLNHYDQEVVKKYLTHISSSLKDKLGSLSSNINAFFSDSLELEGANWCNDMEAEFEKRRGYDIMPYLPFILFKIGGMGNTWTYDHGSVHTGDFKETIQRIRYDFEVTKAELINERFVQTFTNWCRENNVKSRMQAYGRGYFPLEGSFNVDIPECETWIRPGLGTEMSESDYRVGRAYTMINKFVSSAAHLKGKKLISCEELTNIHSVFNETLEIMKIAGDQSIISGVTHPVFHGFNYSPLKAPFPGWVLYGTFINERNPWWPYFPLFTSYKARLSALLQQGVMFADIAILPAIADTWSIYSAQNEPFPAVMHPPWQTFIWEAIHQNGSGCDYVSEKVIRDSAMHDGYMHYGDRKYHTIFLTGIESIEPDTAKKLHEFISYGGRVFCIENYPSKCCGWKDHVSGDQQVQEWIIKMKTFPDKFILLNKPTVDSTSWYKDIQQKYNINAYARIAKPNAFISQVRYRAGESEIFIVINSNMNSGYEISLSISPGITAGKLGWLWDPETGERKRLPASKNILLNLGCSDLKIIVFDREKEGKYQPPGKTLKRLLMFTDPWMIKAHEINEGTITATLKTLVDLKDEALWVNFAGTLIYTNSFNIEDSSNLEYLDLGKVYGVAEVWINDITAGTKWYGNRVYSVKGLVKNGTNLIRVLITTTMGNYLKSLKENKVAQYWTNEGRTIQPLQSMGLIGPITLCRDSAL